MPRTTKPSLTSRIETELWFKEIILKRDRQLRYWKRRAKAAERKLKARK